MVHVKLLGCKWDSKNDILYPGFAELNLNKKVRLAKKANPVPVVTLKDAGRQFKAIRMSIKTYTANNMGGGGRVN